MIYALKNSFLTVLVSSLGGEIQSIRTADDREYIWQGNPASWNRHAPHLFPYIGRLTNGHYYYRGKTYELKQHGFLRDHELTLEKSTDEELVFSFKDTEETRKRYPFSFTFTLTYTLSDNTLTTSYKIENKNNNTMYFGLGGHPGFNVPIDPSLDFEDYYFEFENGVSPKRTLLSENYFISDKITPYDLDKKNRIPLKHNLFDHDAIILSEAGNTVTLGSDQSEHSVLFDFSDFAYLGLWQTPQTTANFVCIEPWTSLSSNDGEETDFERQKNLISLPAGEICKKQWSVKIR